MINFIWLALFLITWLILVIKSSKINIFSSLILVLIGMFSRILQEFVKYVFQLFLGKTALNLIFGPFISLLVIFSFAIIPLLLANKASEKKITQWLYLLFGYFTIALASNLVLIYF
jgi:hypothetical protein